MSEFLLSERAQKLLAGVRSFVKILRILTLVPVVVLLIVDGMYGLLVQKTLWQGFGAIGIGLLAGGIIDFFYVYHVEERQPSTRKVSACCYGALVVAAITTVMVCNGLYSVVTGIMTEHGALELALETYESSALALGEPVAFNAINFIPVISSHIDATALELLCELQEFHRLLWLMSCLLFVIAHAAVTCLNVALIELPYKAQIKAWRVIRANKQ